MTAEEYFGDWIKVINKKELFKIMKWLKTVNPDNLCPSMKNIFKAFRICSYDECKSVWLGLDPYPQKGVAQGILFGNSANTSEEQLSPSLKVVKEAMINYELPHNIVKFDNTLEAIARQGVLLINSSLTCEVGRTGVHSNIWRPFIASLLYNMSSLNSGIVYVLFGRQAQSFRSYITGYQHIFEEYHPAYYARNNEKMPSTIFYKVNEILFGQNGTKIQYYYENYEN